MTMLVTLKYDGVAKIDEEHADIIAPFIWERSTSGYAIARVVSDRGRHSLRMHRLILGAKPGEIVDHIDGDTLNNTRKNLRVVDPSQSVINRKRFKNNKSGIKGVHWDAERNLWRAQIAIYGRVYRLGRFKSKEEASDAYAKASAEFHREFARADE
jgi:hypothetical protein